MVPPIKAAKAIVIILLPVITFHLLVLTGIIPYTIVWGGRLQTQSEMLRFETVSIAINLLMVMLAAVRANWLRLALRPVLVQVGLWLMAGLFLLNTLGNLFSTNRWEQVVFTPLTLVLALLSFWAAKGAPKAKPAAIN
ncbi:hypothetical protein SAMN05444008_12212 [Cnuella takakiae]|uniref:Uncharacterized protein n=1 Tax=Cnuella takakiae TaxID=1302690 RepID=A0A1M5I7A6_9BACT|nr:hypothetical protein [Cnuella takakiae]OLY93186.1 hypothetical protein BUE76_15790 [Cnuella takakiae]SHG23683.1 hypothetical protein SAMN05444008_12212 [Cnuella takakiae]